MREINRVIASALIFSKDNKLLMWKKDPKDGWVYVDCWHIPWGWVDEWESLTDAVIREVREEVWLDISNNEIMQLPFPDTWVAEKTLKETGERVLCHMEFNRFKIIIDKNANEIPLRLSDDLVEVEWFDMEALAHIKQIPWWKEFFQKMGYVI